MARKKDKKYTIRKNYTLGPLDMRPATNARVNSAFAISQENVYRSNSDALLVRPGKETILSDIAASGSVGPKNGIFTLGDEVIFAETSSLYRLSPVEITAAYTATPPETLILEDKFETGDFATFWTEKYVDTDYYTPNTSEDYIVEGSYRTTDDYTGLYKLHIYIVAGETEQQPIKLSLFPSATPGIDIYTLLGNRREIYIEFAQWFTTGYPWPDGSQKIVQCGYFDGNEVGGYGPVSIASGSNLEDPPRVDTSEDWEVMFTVNGDNGGSGDGSDGNKWHMAQFINSRSVGTHWVLTDNPTPNIEPTNQWVVNALHLKLNSAAGVNDGFLRWYQDGVNILTSVDSPYLWGGDIDEMPLADAGVVNHPINSISIGLNYSMHSGVSAQEGHRYLDRIRIYGTKP